MRTKTNFNPISCKQAEGDCLTNRKRRLREAFLLGLLAGDGAKHLAKNGRYMVWIDQHIKNIKILEKARNILRDLGFNVFFYSIQESKKRIMVYSKKLFQQFDEMMKNPTQFFPFTR